MNFQKPCRSPIKKTNANKQHRKVVVVATRFPQWVATISPPKILQRRKTHKPSNYSHSIFSIENPVIIKWLCRHHSPLIWVWRAPKPDYAYLI
jgi:hypothetical protein